LDSQSIFYLNKSVDTALSIYNATDYSVVSVRLSVVWNVCIVAKRCVLPKKCLKKQIGNAYGDSNVTDDVK